MSCFPHPLLFLVYAFQKAWKFNFLPFNWFVSIQIEDFSCTSLSRLPSTNLYFHPYSSMLLWKIALLFVMAREPQNETWWWYRRPQTFQILYLVFFNMQHEHDRILVLPIQYHLCLRRTMEKIFCNWLSSTLTITLQPSSYAKNHIHTQTHNIHKSRRLKIRKLRRNCQTWAAWICFSFSHRHIYYTAWCSFYYLVFSKILMGKNSLTKNNAKNMKKNN